MPTGYTAAIESGEEKSVKSFLASASRGMGLYIMQRDEDSDVPPAKREMSPFYQESVNRARVRLAELQNMTEAEKTAAFNEAVAAAEKSRQEAIDKNERVRQNYQDMMYKVAMIEWPDDPTDEAYQFFVGFKKFVTEQLNDSYNFDVSDDPGYWHMIPQNMEDWYAQELAGAKTRLEYDERYLVEERERVRSQNYVHDKFMEFLEGLE